MARACASGLYAIESNEIQSVEGIGDVQSNAFNVFFVDVRWWMLGHIHHHHHLSTVAILAQGTHQALGITALPFLLYFFKNSWVIPGYFSGVFWVFFLPLFPFYFPFFDFFLFILCLWHWFHVQ